MSRQAEAALATITSSLADHDMSLDVVHRINADNDMASICKNIAEANTGLVIIAGGDGTVSSALHYLADSAIDIGIIPLGTTNNFARSLNIPFEIDAAIKLITTCKAQPIDLGVANGHHFANIVGVGLSTAIAQDVPDGLKKKLGRLAYAVIGLQKLLTHRAFRVTISDENKGLAVELETHQIIIANGRYHAGKKIAADVAVDNHELVIFALGGRGWLSFMWHTLDFYLGRRKKIVHGSYLTGNNVLLTTNRPQKVEVDGEVGPQTPLNLNVHPGAVMIRCTL